MSTDGKTEWTDDGVSYFAEVRGGDLVSLRVADESTLPRQSFDLLSWMREQRERNLDELLMDFRERAKQENVLDRRRERDAAAESAAADAA